MPDPTLLELLRSSDLLSSEQLGELEGLPEAADPEPKALARAVLLRGWLTRFQLSQAAAGRAGELLVGPYLLLDRLGEGAMGQVFKARHRHMNRLVALKLIRKEKLASADAVSRFYREVQAAAQLHHPNIALAFDAGQAGATHFLAMEFVDGPDLARLVRDRGPLPVAQACDFIRQAAEGLQHAHERGLVHRDVKPSNLLVSVGGGRPVVKVLDLGLARLGDSFARERELTRAGQVVGTPDYMAPEQALDARGVDVRADVYSLGCTLYFLLAGRAPFRAESLAELLMKHQTELPSPIRSLRPEVPSALEAVIVGMLAKNPDGRPATPAEVASALAPFADGNAGTTELEPPAIALAPVAPSRKGERSPDLSSSRSQAVARTDRERSSARAAQPPASPRTKKERNSPPEIDEALPADTGSRLPVIVGLVAGGLAVLGLLIGGVVWAMRSAPPQGAAPPSLLASSDPGEKETEKKPVPEPKQDPSSTTPPPDVKEPQKPDPVVKKADVPPDKGVGEVARFTGQNKGIRRVAWSRDGMHVLTACHDNMVRVFDMPQFKMSREQKGHTAGVNGVAFFPSDKEAITGGGDKTLRIWDVTTGIERKVLDGEMDIHTVAVSADGRWAASSGHSDTVFLWDLEKQRIHRRFTGHRPEVGGLAFSPTGDLLLTGDASGTIRAWRTQHGTKGGQFTGHPGSLFGLRVTADGEYAFSAGDSTIRLWSLRNGKEVKRYEGHKGNVLGFALSPDGRRLLSCSDQDRHVQLWDVETGAMIHRFEGHSALIWDVAFSPDCKYAVSGSTDGTLCLRRLPTDELTGIPRKRSAPPDDATQEKVEKEIKEKYKVEYAYRDPSELMVLATTLLQLARGTTAAPARRFVLMREARDVAARAGNFALSRTAALEQAFFYTTDDLAGRAEALKVASRSTAVKRLAAASAALELIDDAIAADRYETAEAALAIARSAAWQVKNADVARRLPRAGARVAHLRKEFTNVEKAALTLARQPGDAEASLALGKFYCFHKDDWARGLPLLASGADPALAALARKELASPAMATEQAAVAHAWWDLAEKESGAAQRHLAGHARDFFQQALPALPDLERIKVEKKLKKTISRTGYRPGLVAEYFADEGLTKMVKSRRDYQVNFRWGEGSPALDVPADHFSVRWQGWFIPPQKGKYTLCIQADDGARLAPNRTVKIDTWTRGGQQTVDVVVTDKPIHLQIDYHDSTGDAHVILGWVEGSTARPVPMGWLYHDEQQEKLLAK